MNKFMCMGRISQMSELKAVGESGKALNFSVAINRYNGKNKESSTDFIPVSAFNANAENIARLFKVGAMIAIEGNLEPYNYTDKEGIKKYSFRINLERFYFCGSKKENQGTEENPADNSGPTNQPAPTYASADNSDFEEIADDDLPF